MYVRDLRPCLYRVHVPLPGEVLVNPAAGNPAARSRFRIMPHCSSVIVVTTSGYVSFQEKTMHLRQYSAAWLSLPLATFPPHSVAILVRYSALAPLFPSDAIHTSNVLLVSNVSSLNISIFYLLSSGMVSLTGNSLLDRYATHHCAMWSLVPEALFWH